MVNVSNNEKKKNFPCQFYFLNATLFLHLYIINSNKKLFFKIAIPLQIQSFWQLKSWHIL